MDNFSQFSQYSQFTLNRVINEDTRIKHVALCLNSPSGETAVALIERIPFDSTTVFTELLQGEVELVNSNDIYQRFLALDRGIECKMIYPATEAHVTKYSEQERRIILETPEMHQKITRPFFESLRRSGQVLWIDNIIADGSEMENRIVDYKCPEDGFIILPDYKWTDETNINSLYLLAIPRRKDLWSVRDLSGSTLPLLKSIRSMLKSIFNSTNPKYKFSNGSPVIYEHLRIFFHYPPTFPHLHIHITLAGSTSIQSGAAIGQAILLDEVIDNIENIAPDYYSKRTLSMQFGLEHALYKQLQQ